MGPVDVLSTPLLAGWAAWLLVGLALAAWARRARDADMRRARTASAPPQPLVAARPIPPPAHAPHGDAFAELQALLDAPEREHSH